MSNSLDDIKVNIVVSLKGKSKLEALENTMRGIVNVQSGLTKSLGKTVGGLMKVEEKAAAANATLGKTKTILSQVAAGTNTLAKAQQKQANVAASGMRQQVDAGRGLMTRLSNLEGQYDSAYRAAFRLQITGASLLFTGKQLMDMLGGLTKAWGDFEFMVNRAAGALSLFKGAGKATDALYGELIKGVQSASKELALFPVEEVAKATYFWGSTTGQTVESLNDLKTTMAAIQPLMKLSAMTQTDYETAIKGVYAIIVQYGRSLYDVEDISQKLFYATQKTALEFNDLIMSFKMVGPIAESLGITFEQMVDLFGKLGDAGIKGTMAGRAFRQMFIKLTKPTEIAAKRLDTLFKGVDWGAGIVDKSFNEMVFPEGKFIGMSEYIRMLAFALKDADQKQRGFILGTITTANELPVMTALIEKEIRAIKGLPGGWNAAKTSVDEAGKAADQFNKSWTILAESWNGITARIARGIEVLRVSFGQKLAEALTPVVNNLNILIDKAQAWVDKNPEVVSSALKLAGIGAGLTILAGAAFIAMGALLGVATAAIHVARAVSVYVPQAAATFGMLAAIATAIVRNFDYVKYTITSALKDLQAAFSEAGLAGKDLKTYITELHESTKPFFDFLVKTGAQVLALIIRLFGEIIKSPLRSWFESLAKALMLAFAVQTLGRITGITKAIGLLTAITARASAAMAAMAGATAAQGAAAGAAVGPVGRLSLALKALGLSGPMLLATAVAIGAIVAYETNMLGFRDAINVVIRQFRDFKGEVQSWNEANLGGQGDRLMQHWEKAAEAAGNYAKKEEYIAAHRQEVLDSFDPLSKVIFSEETRYGELLKENENQRLETIQNYQKQVDSLASKYGTTTREFATTTATMMEKYNLTYDDAIKATSEFYNLHRDGEQATTKSINSWYNAIKTALGDKAGGIRLDSLLSWNIDAGTLEQERLDRNARTSLSAAQSYLNSGNYEMAAPILNGLKSESSKYSADVNRSVDLLLSGVPEAVRNRIDESAEIAEMAAPEIVTALIGGFKGMKDLNKVWKKVSKQLKAPKDWGKRLARQLTSGAFSEAETSGKLGGHDWAVSQIDSIMSQANLAFQQAGNDPAQQEALGKSLARALAPKGKNGVDWEKLGQLYTKDIDKIGKVTLTEEQKTALQGLSGQVFDAMSMAKPTAGSMGQTIENWYLDSLATSTANMQGAVDAAMAPIKGVPGTLNSLATPAYNGSANVMQSAINGVNDKFPAYKAAIDKYTSYYDDHMIGESPTKKGPLHNVTSGARNVMGAYIKGMASKEKDAQHAASSMATRINSSLAEAGLSPNSKMSVSTDSARKVSVDIKVSSPDGTANRMTQSQIMTALRSGGLISNIERLATVD